MSETKGIVCVSASFNRGAAGGQDRRFTLQRGVAGYDRAIREHLTHQLFDTLVEASTIENGDGKRVCCMRTSEAVDALADLLVTVMSMIAEHDTPSVLRKNCELLAQHVRKAVARARAEGAADILGGARGGHA